MGRKSVRDSQCQCIAFLVCSTMGLSASFFGPTSAPKNPMSTMSRFFNNTLFIQFWKYIF
jgi:hypothetical protein